MYKLIKETNVVTEVTKDVGILRFDGWFIPLDSDNTDYQTYLKWVAEGNLPSPADIVEPSQASVTPLPADE